MPPALIDFLRGEGFQVLEPFAGEGARPAGELRGVVYRVTDRGALPVTDALRRLVGCKPARHGMDGEKVEHQAFSMAKIGG